MIYRSILKNGYSSFSIEILEYCDPSIAVSREQYYLNLLNPEYNILKKAGSLLGFKHSEETIVQMSAVARGRKHLPETIAKMKNPKFKAERLAHLNHFNANAEFEIKRLERLKIYNSSPEHLEHLNRLHSSTEHKEHLKGLSENLAKSLKGRLRPEGAGRKSVSIEVLDSLTDKITIYPSISETARALGMAQQSISSAFSAQAKSEKKGCTTALLGKMEQPTIWIKNKRYKITKLSK